MKSHINFFAILFFTISILLYGVAFHNIDMAFNMPDNLVDTNPFGVVRTKPEIYLAGLQALIIAIMFQFISFFLLLFFKI